MSFSRLTIVSFVHTGMFSCVNENSYVINRAGRRDCVVVDPGINPQALIQYIQEKDFVLSGILVTHGHYDHIGGIPDLKEVWPDAPVYVGELDRPKFGNAKNNLSRTFGVPLVVEEAEVSLSDRELVYLAGIEFKTIWVPGHSRGHLIYLFKEEEQTGVFVGDVIFAGNIGATEFGDGDFNELLQGIERSILPLPEDTILFPGHGKTTTVLIEKRTNRWLKFSFIERGKVRSEFLEGRIPHRDTASDTYRQPTATGVEILN